MLRHPKTKWFFTKFSKFERSQLKDLWYDQMNQEQRDTPFFDRLSFKINKQSTIMAINKSTQSWKTEKG